MFPKIIVVTGVDGSGKTTQAKLLSEHFKSKGYKCVKTDQFSSGRLLSILIKILGDRLEDIERGTSNKAEICGDNNQDSKAKKLLRTLAITRIILTGLSHTWIRVVQNLSIDYIIFDRYYYDVIIKLIWMYELPRDKLDILTKIIPQPDLVLFLEVDSDTALQRETDDDLTRRQMTLKNKKYTEYFSDKVGDRKFVEINANKDIKEVRQNLLEAIYEANK